MIPGPPPPSSLFPYLHLPFVFLLNACVLPSHTPLFLHPFPYVLPPLSLPPPSLPCPVPPTSLSPLPRLRSGTPSLPLSFANALPCLPTYFFHSLLPFHTRAIPFPAPFATSLSPFFNFRLFFLSSSFSSFFLLRVLLHCFPSLDSSFSSSLIFPPSISPPNPFFLPPSLSSLTHPPLISQSFSKTVGEPIIHPASQSAIHPASSSLLSKSVG